MENTINVIELVRGWGAFAIMVKTFIGIISVPGGYSIMVVPNSPRQKIKLIMKATNSVGIIKGIKIFSSRL